MLTATAFFALLSACQQAESPAEVSEDVAGAGSQVEMDTALTQAEGDYRVAMERCESLAGDEQSACKQEAQNMFDAARQAAEGPPGPS